MERQVRDMLMFVKGDIPLNETVSLETLARTLEEAIEAPVASYGGTCYWLKDFQDGSLQCNLDALCGAILNLVNNSLQSKSEANIQLHIEQRHTKTMGDELIIRVIDDGPGLDEASLEQVGELFYTTKIQGTGIGLAVVRAVMESHGGHFSLNNHINGGACASLFLPLSPSSSHDNSTTIIE